jgi:protein prenyltransferase alpha subunit repeat containing protein 1
LPDESYEFTQQAGSPDEHQAATPFLFIEGNLGVPKKALYRTYVEALVIFASARKSTFGEEVHSAQAVHTLVASSVVILLANPGHLTALNARKRFIQRRVLDSKRELELTAALLTSRNCSNQSILWHHRQWLLHRIYGPFDGTMQSSEAQNTLSQIRTSPDGEISSHVLVSREVIDKELSITSRACELYSRNYFAWTHRHFCMGLVIHSLNSTTDPTYLEEMAKLVSDEVTAIRLWIERHISDSSAVHYLVTLIERLSAAGTIGILPFAHPHPENCLLPNVDDIAQTGASDLFSSMSHAMSLLRSYPDHESLWQYFRAISQLADAKSDDIQAFTHSFIYPWACRSLSPSGFDSMQISIYAYRFLAWQAFQVGTSMICTNTTLKFANLLEG